MQTPSILQRKALTWEKNNWDLLIKSAWYVVDTSNKILTQLLISIFQSNYTNAHYFQLLLQIFLYMFFSCLLALCFTFGFPFIWSKVSPGHAGFNCSSLIYKLCFSVTRKTFLGKCIGISDLHIKAQCSLPSVMQPSLSFLLLQSTNILFVINAQWRLKHELY